MSDDRESGNFGAMRYDLFGLGLIVLAAAMWSLNGALIKLVFQGGKGPHPVVIAFYRSLFAGLVLLPLARRRLQSLRPEKSAPSLLGLHPAGAACVLFFTLMTVCFVAANTKTEAANAIILQYTSTFWVFGLSPWLLKETPRRKDLWMLAVAIVGIAVIFFGNANTDLLGLCNALAAGLFYALLTLMIRRLRHADSAAVTVMNNLGSAVLIIPFTFLVGGIFVTGREAVLLIIMGVFQFGLPYYFYTRGLARVPAYQAALVTMLEPVLVPVWTYLAVGERVPLPTVVGGSIILAALASFAWSAGRSGMWPRTRPPARFG